VSDVRLDAYRKLPDVGYSNSPPGGLGAICILSIIVCVSIACALGMIKKVWAFVSAYRSSFGVLTHP
jgi:hypothetical protein